MSFIGRIPSVIDAVGISAIDINKALAESLAVREGVVAKTKEVRDYWKKIAPVMKVPPGKDPHPVSSGSSTMISQGMYRDSIKIKYGHDPVLYGYVYTDANPLSYWLEYGSIHNEEKAYAQQVANEFRNTERVGPK